MHLLFGSVLDPFVAAIWWVVQEINLVVRSLGWSLVILAALIRAVFWGLNVKQFKAMLSMQRIAPKLKAIQAKYKGDQQRIQQETMALYRDAGVNPLAGCLPMIVQLPILYSVYWVVLLNDTVRNGKIAATSMCSPSGIPSWFASFPLHQYLHPVCFNTQHFLWIGTAISAKFPVIFAANLAGADVILLALYAGSMYFSMRYGSVPSTDEQQAQVQRMMAIFSPLLIAYFGWRAHWPSAMILYWFSYNAFTMAQQVYMLRRYHQPLSALDSEHVVTDVGVKQAVTAKDATLALGSQSAPQPGAQNPSRRRRRRRKK